MSYICIDLKSFYASVECAERGLDPMTARLVVADPERSNKTICLAVSPALKKMGVKNRCRVFEIPENIDYIMAPPRMQKYIDYAADIYGVYLDYISPADIHVYSIDEVFINVAPYLDRYGKTPKEMALMLMDKVYSNVGVRASAGVGTNLYLTKVALDITAKHSKDFIGVLNEKSYRKKLWDHRPLTDFWRIGRGTAKELERMGLLTMGDIACCDEELLYDHFGIDAELLIDHAWGRESTTIADIKNYRPEANSLTSGQVLMRDYSFDEAVVIVREMVENLCLSMSSKKVITDSVSFSVGYSHTFHRESDRGTVAMREPTNMANIIIPAVLAGFEKVTDKLTPVRRINISCNDLEEEKLTHQLTLEEMIENDIADKSKMQNAVVDIKERFGKNAVFRGTDLQDCATALERNRQIGGHKSGV